MNKCPNCKKETEGALAKDGTIWAVCPECYKKVREREKKKGVCPVCKEKMTQMGSYHYNCKTHGLYRWMWNQLRKVDNDSEIYHPFEEPESC